MPWSMKNLTVRSATGAQMPSAPEWTPALLTAGYGVCKWRMTCGCGGYLGMNNQACQRCGHGFGEHF
jgi:hypothetical protein